MKYWKKILTAIILLAIIITCVAAFVSRKDRFLSDHDENAVITIHFEYGEILIHEKLTQEETKTVLQIINGKRHDKDLYYTGAGCGYGPEYAIEVDDTTYYVSKDDCGALQKADSKAESNDYYLLYDLSTEEFETLRAIFRAYGATYK